MMHIPYIFSTNVHDFELSISIRNLLHDLSLRTKIFKPVPPETQQRMIGSMKRRRESKGSPVRRGGRAGESQCELCGERRTCSDQFGIEACRACHVDFLPSHGVL